MTGRQQAELTEILRDLDLVVYRLESPSEGAADERVRLSRDVEELRRRLEVLSHDLG